MEVYGEDELFFGSKRVHFATAPGAAYNYQHKDWAPSDREADLKLALSRKDKFAEAGSSVADIVVPAIPALELVCSSEVATEVASWPELLQKPLIKVKEPQPAGTHTFTS